LRGLTAAAEEALAVSVVEGLADLVAQLVLAVDVVVVAPLWAKPASSSDMSKERFLPEKGH
jgi:hypothetical protein